MVRADNPRSQLVAWLKVLLPLAALAILSTLFLVAETLDPEAAIPYAERGEIDDLVEEQRISAPSFAAVTEDGTSVTVSAETARPDPGDGEALLGQALRAEFVLPGGKVVSVDGPSGRIDGASREAMLTGGARLEGSDGTLVETETVTAAFDGAFAESAGPVQATGPAGRLTAGRMTLGRSDDGAYLLRFTGGVRLLYEPQTKE